MLRLTRIGPFRLGGLLLRLTVRGHLTHVGPDGKARQVDVSEKANTLRTAMASARVLFDARSFGLLAANQLAKGDALGVSRIAGISAAKLTPLLIPLCHSVNLSEVKVDLQLLPTDLAVLITATARAVGPTGVEMEALTAASTAALTLYDMCKASSKVATQRLSCVCVTTHHRAS